MHSAVGQAHEARLANRRAKRHAVELERLIDEAAAVDRLSFIASDLSDLILGDHLAPGPDAQPTRVPRGLRIPIGEALQLLASALMHPHSETKRDELSAADARLVAVLDQTVARADGPEDLILNSVVLSLRRGLESFADQTGDEQDSRSDRA